jgi:8-amino-7-oxononanoate synthase
MEQHLHNILQKRKANNLFRKLKTESNSIDFCSNNYLGFSDKDWKIESKKNGATGSRLISGHSAIFDTVEQQIATFHNTEAALIFNSGYDANLGFFSCVPQKGDTVIYDSLCHASIRDGLRLGLANNFSFKHNDIADLEKKILKASGTIFVAIESIYSMDGDVASLEKISKICKANNANLIVDEAHATGVFGKNGVGLCQELNITTFARTHTFSKALGCHGAAIVSSQNLKDYLINFARSFIYTTAMPEHSILCIQKVVEHLNTSTTEQETLHQKIALFQQNFKNENLIYSTSAIQSIIIGGNEKTKEIAITLQQAEFDIRPILHPTVPKGSERIRICLHAFNTDEDIIALCKKLTELL